MPEQGVGAKVRAESQQKKNAIVLPGQGLASNPLPLVRQFLAGAAEVRGSKAFSGAAPQSNARALNGKVFWIVFATAQHHISGRRACCLKV